VSSIGACDLAEVLGSAVALNLLFHIPLLWAVIITGLDVLLPAGPAKFGMRTIEAGDDDCPQQWDLKQQIECDGRSLALRQVTSADGKLHSSASWAARPPGIPIAAALREVFFQLPLPGGRHHLP